MASTLPHLRSFVEQNGAVILDIRTNRVRTLNATGGYIWDKLLQGKQSEEIATELAAVEGVDKSIVSEDVEAFLRELASRNLITYP